MEKLYEQDPYLNTFSAVVESCVRGAQGWDTVLSRTAFYPGGGGQPADRGTLAGIEVLALAERDDRIVHTCAAPLEVGSQITGEIDFDHRFDLMQQHSGEHILSGLAHAMFGCDNVGFHLGKQTVTIDLNVVLTWEQALTLEEAANAYIWRDRAVEITFPDEQALAALDYRSKKALTGAVRIVTFPGADTCACCGTHVSSAGQVGLAKLLSCQRFRSGVRLELLCGARAMRYLSRVWEENQAVSALLSAKPLETSAATSRLLNEAESLKASLASMQDEHFASLAEQYAGVGDVLRFEPGLSPDALRHLAGALHAVCGGDAACFSGTDEDGYRYAVVHADGDLRAYAGELNRALRGRGGGKDGLIQGRVEGTRAEIEAFFSVK